MNKELLKTAYELGVVVLAAVAVVQLVQRNGKGGWKSGKCAKKTAPASAWFSDNPVQGPMATKGFNTVIPFTV